MNTVLLLLPDFALIFLGAALRRFGGLGDGFWVGLERLVYFVLFPALLFLALARTRIDWLGMMPLAATGAATLGAGLVLGCLVRPLAGLSPMGFASRLQCAFRFNTYVGMAVVGKVHGAAGV
ncbi:MAG: AEC family transporter, partial [Rhodocyclaceae bacterium]|nr:AEC family transporter [Rhodocyclaceae bacterium]